MPSSKMEGYQSGDNGNGTETLDVNVSSVSPNKRKLSLSASVSPQVDALKTIYQSLGGPEWTCQENWLLEDHDCFEWQGITCSEGTGDGVTVLDLSQNNLRGRLDDPVLVDAFVKLGPTLEQLWLNENTALTGNLPSVFADASIFPQLDALDVMNNQLSGLLHPSFAKRKTELSCLDTSGNELTSYYRYTGTSANSNSDHNEDEADVNVNVGPMSSPLPHVHVAQSLLTEPQCLDLIDMAVRHAEANGGWKMGQHKAYRTTDVDISVVGGKLLDTCNDHLRTTILPLMARLFDISLCDLAIDNLFLAKYSAIKGQQGALSEHLDDSELSFIVTLNDAFQGGGTCFHADDTTGGTIVKPNCGAGALFCGRRMHSGVEVTEGDRYILAGFVRVFPSTPTAVATLNSLLKQTTIVSTQGRQTEFSIHADANTWISAG
jgi:hypothetical protein